MTPLTPGSRLGRFEVLAALGEGGMGAVYRARDAALNRDVAIKIVRPDVAGDADRLARFAREAQILASLNHPHIAAIYGLEDLGGAKALVLELVDGPTLADRIAAGPLPLDEALDIAAQIADALAAAHDQGIVHRDLKPANVKVRPDGTVKVLDFGLAKAMAVESVAGSNASTVLSPTLSLRATTAGLILGTAAYMSPEQASGKTVDRRADVWSFGVVLWEMLTGRRMFEGETISHVLAAVLTAQPDLTQAPPSVRRLLASCLEKDPRKRLRDIGDAMRLVDAPGPRTTHDRPAPRRAVVFGWAVAGVLAAVLAATLWPGPSPVTAPAAGPAVRLQIERTAVDPYNNAGTAFAVSPDGQLLAYYDATSDGRAVLWVRALATGERREVQNSASTSPAAPFFSADSRQLVYVTPLNASVLDLVTGAVRELCDCRFRGGSMNRDGVILLGAPPNELGSLVRITPGDATPIAAGRAAGEHDTLPTFLPDGTRFVFTRTRGTGAKTYIGSLDGAAPTKIADGARSTLTVGPDGHGRLFGIDASGLVAQDFDVDTGRTQGEPRVVLPGAVAASASMNGVLVTSIASPRRMTVPTWHDRSGRPLTTVGAPGALTALAVTADDRTVVVGQQLAAGGGLALSLHDPAGGITRLVARGDAPVLSPNGTRFVSTALRDGKRSLFERSVSGSGQERRVVEAVGSAFANDWSRDGRYLIYTDRKADGSALELDLWTIRMDDPAATPAPYLTGPTRDGQAEFSPDGHFVVYTSVGTGDPEIYVQPFPNAADGKWLISTKGGVEPHWSRNGKELYYWEGQTMMAVPVRPTPRFSAGTPTRLFDAQALPWYINDSDRTQVSADGRFLFLVPDGPNPIPPIDIVVNWTMPPGETRGETR